MVWAMIIDKKKYSNIVRRAVFVFVLVLIWIIFAFSTENPDYHIYENWYRITRFQGLIDRFEVGFSAFMLLCNKLGLSYQQFLMLLSAVGLILIADSLLDYCRYPTLALILYAFYPLLFDIVQIRNFLGEALIFFALRYLKEYNLKNFISYVVFCIGASLFHITSLFYLVFLIVYVKDYKKIVKFIIILTLSLLIFYIFLNSVFIKISAMFGNMAYIEEGSTFSKIIGYGGFAIFATVLMYIYHFTNDSLLKEKEVFIPKLIPVLIICCVVIMVSSQAYRLFRNMALIIYVAFLNDGALINGTVIRGKMISYINTIFAIFFSAFFYIRQLSQWSPMFERLTKVIIKSNTFFFK